ncbi:MAG: hypothetical protein IT424_08315 [Pirellulales bacterium]|nr:hypothetical protein [Pirellulales bacterium]
MAPRRPPRPPAQASLAALLAVAVVASAGCASSSNKWQFASWDVRRAVGWKTEPEKPEPQIPTRVVATWADTTLTKAGEQPLRGFGGRLSFFGRESEDPVRVEGQLVVYAFDETSRPTHETQPTRRYIFPADEFLRHESASSLGPSYSFWLPWDAVGGPQRKISLIARFEPKEGPIVLSEQTRHLLPGPTDPDDGPLIAADERSALVSAVRNASYAGQAVPATQGPLPLASPVEEDKAMSTATIPLPPRLAANVAQSAGALDERINQALPLSQIAALERQQAASPARQPASDAADAAAADHPPAAVSRAPVRRPPTAARQEEPVPLRDSLLETLPVRGRQAAPPAHVRAR